MNLVETSQNLAISDEDDDTAAWQYLTFTLQDEIYALGILNVIEIIDCVKITLIPMMPVCIRGVINLRGLVVPVVDLLARFDYGIATTKERTSVVIVEFYDSENEKKQKIGIMVDAVNEVIEIPPEQIEPAPQFGVGLRTDFIAGMARKYEKFLIILAIERVLAVNELVNLAKMLLHKE